MSYSFTKLFSSITDSSIWCEDSDTKVVWVTMLAMCDQNGEVHAAIPGLAKRAGVSVAATEVAVAKFIAPDPHSRTKTQDGRRIEEIDGGWRLVNYGLYREMRDAETRKEYLRNYMRDYRARKQSVNICKQNVNNVNHSKPPLTQAEAEADTDIKDIGKSKRSAVASPTSDEEWLVSLERTPAYEGINIREQFSRMQQWCLVNRKEPTRRRFINWLNRADKPIKTNGKDVRINPRDAGMCQQPAHARSVEEVIREREAKERERMAEKMDSTQRDLI